MQTSIITFEERIASGETVRALSLKQPYADLFVNHNKIETRTYKSTYRGLVLIHASGQPYTETQVGNISGIFQFGRIYDAVKSHFSKLPKGVALAMAELYDCRNMRADQENETFVKYAAGRNCWYFANMRKVEPFPFKNSLGMPVLTEDIIKQIKFI